MEQAINAWSGIAQSLESDWNVNLKIEEALRQPLLNAEIDGQSSE
jgi:hypothetical protein